MPVGARHRVHRFRLRAIERLSIASERVPLLRGKMFA
jgi:hypothetical protein